MNYVSSDQLAVTGGVSMFGLSLAVGWWVLAVVTLILCGIFMVRMAQRATAER